MAQIAQSHALSFFLLSGPDFLLGYEFDIATRNMVGLIKKYPNIARDGIALRTRAGAGDGAVLDLALMDAHQQFRRGAGQFNGLRPF